jgi:hypothetical protein
MTVIERAPGRDLGPFDPSGLDRWHSALEPPPPRGPRFDDPRRRRTSSSALLLASHPARRSPDPFEYFAGAFAPALVLFAKHGSDDQELVDRIMKLTATGGSARMAERRRAPRIRSLETARARRAAAAISLKGTVENAG